jgi:hypothetical protein
MLFKCGPDLRRQAVKASADINGIDYLEVTVFESTPLVPKLRTLLFVYCFKSIELSGIKEENINIAFEGGVRRKDIKAEWTESAKTIIQNLANGITNRITSDLSEEERKVINGLHPESIDLILIIRPNKVGDFSTYSLELVDSENIHQPPANFDPLLSQVDFSFRASCKADFDCKPQDVCIDESETEPAIDYMAKDFASFRRLMLDRLSTTIPNWKERNPADMGIMKVEIASYIADHLSYFQDAVATEAYLGTARRRVSVRRHVRLLDYYMHEGCNARTWVCFESSELAKPKLSVKRGTKVMTRPDNNYYYSSSNRSVSKSPIIDSSDFEDRIKNGAQAFETMHDLDIYEHHNSIPFYTWGNSQCCLSKGATSASIKIDENFGQFLFNWDDVVNVPSSLEPAQLENLRQWLSEQLKLEWLHSNKKPIQLIPTIASKKMLELTNGEESLYLLLNEEEKLVNVVTDAKGNFELGRLLAFKDMTREDGKLGVYSTTLKAGDFLVFEETLSPTTFSELDVDPSHRHVVRLEKVTPNFDKLFGAYVLDISWSEEDALPFTLCMEALSDGGNTHTAGEGGGVSQTMKIISVARGNVALVDHGYTLTKSITPALLPNHDRFLDLGQNFSIENFGGEYKVDEGGRIEDDSDSSITFVDSASTKQATEFIGYAPFPFADSFEFQPRLTMGPLTFLEPMEDIKKSSATKAIKNDPRKAKPIIKVFRLDGSTPENVWEPGYDYLGAKEFDRIFVVETENDGTALIRFYDPTAGARSFSSQYSSTPERHSISSSSYSPSIKTVYPFFATYRIGNGTRGNVGPETITEVVLDGVEKSQLVRIRNPIAASGGTDPENIELVRQYAPEAFRVQERAITPEDYVDILKRHPQVQRANAVIRWTGSWYTVFVAIDRYRGKPIDSEFKQSLHNFLNYYRLIGYDMEITEPSFVPLQIKMRICLALGHYFGNVERKLYEVFSSRINNDGTRGFFHADNLSFGQPILLSKIYEAALRVDGVASCKVDLFQRWGKLPNNEIEKAAIEMQFFEIARLDNDSNFPENGKIEFLSGDMI